MLVGASACLPLFACETTQNILILDKVSTTHRQDMRNGTLKVTSSAVS